MIPRSRQAKCPSCSADITEALPSSCVEHLHPALVLAYASIKRQFTPKKIVKPREIPYYLELDRPMGEQAYLEKLENDWWQESGLPALRAAYPEY